MQDNDGSMLRAALDQMIGEKEIADLHARFDLIGTNIDDVDVQFLNVTRTITRWGATVATG